ncbi:MAG: hypothetical protein U9R53_03325 [Chloroflexota bacterium]|nr:hypothetical protein [Chloroflexota bacterium]
MLVLTACTQLEVDQPLEGGFEAEVVPDSEEDNEDAQMKSLISEKIAHCHGLDFILSKNKTREEWSSTIDRMIKKGTKISAEEKERIIEWLVSRND